MPQLSEYLSNCGWDIINENFFFNEKLNAYIKVLDNRLSYFINNKEVEEIPLTYSLHHTIDIPDKNTYEKILRLIKILENKGLTPTLRYFSYRFKEFPDEYWAGTSFAGLFMYTERGGIECTAKGASAYEMNFGEDLFVEDDVIRNTILEIAKLLNPEFYYDPKSGFEIPLEKKKEIIILNKNSW